MIKEKYISNIKQTAINVTNSQIDSVRKKDITKTGCRVYKDGYIGVAGAIGKYDEEKLTTDAIEALNLKVEYNCDASENREEKIDKVSEIIKEDELVDEFKDVLQTFRLGQSEFSFSNKIIMTENNVRLVNDKKLNLEYSDKSLAIELLFKEKSSSNIIDGGLVFMGRSFDKKAFIEESNMILNAYKNKVDLPKNGVYPVVFTESSAIFFMKFMTELYGKLFASGASLFSNKLGQKLFSDKFTFYQSINPDDVYNIPFFDAEGVVNKDYRYALIEKGIIKAPYTDKRTAKMFGLENTGSAAAEYDSVPSTNLLGYKVEESKNTVKELLGGQMGILTVISDGGDFTPDGGFGTPVQLSFLFDGEKIIGRLPELQISSNVFDMFGNSYRGVGCNKVFPASNEKMVVMDLNVSKM